MSRSSCRWELRVLVHLRPGRVATTCRMGRDRQLALITVRQLHVAGVGAGDRGGARERDAAPHVSGRLPRRSSDTRSGCHSSSARSRVRSPSTFVSHRLGRSALGVRATPPADGRRRHGGARAVAESRDGLRVHQVERLSMSRRTHRRGHPHHRAGAHAHRLRRRRTGADEAERAIAEAFALKLSRERRAPLRRSSGPGSRRRGAGPGDPRSPRPSADHPLRRGAAMLRLIRGREFAGSRSPTTPWRGSQRGLLAGRTQRLIVEVDGYPFHGHRSAFERDHRKTLRSRAGYVVVRSLAAARARAAPLAAVIARALDRRSRTRG